VGAGNADRAGFTRSAWAAWLAFGLGYLVLAGLGDWLTSESSQFSTFWPAAGLYVGALLLSERRRWPGIVAAAAMADLIVSWRVGRRPLLAVALTLGDALEALMAAGLIQAAVRGRPRMWRLRDLLAVIVLGAVVAPIVPGLIGGATTAFTNPVSLPRAWADWWAGDGLGILVVTPLVLAWGERDSTERNPVRQRPLEFAALMACVLGASWAVFHEARRGALSWEYVVLPVFVWAALRFGPRGVTAASALLASAAAAATAWAAWLGGPRALAPDAAPLQVFLALAVATSLILASEVAGRGRSEQKLRLARYALDQGGEAFLIANAAGIIVLASQAAGRLLGRAPSELAHTPIGLVDPALSASAWAGQWSDLQRRGTIRYETTLQEAGQRQLPAEVNLACLSFDGSLMLSWSARDLSARRRTEEEHRLAAVGTLASGVAHEINNPLTYITSNLAFVEEALGGMRGLHRDVAEAEAAVAEAAVGARRVRDIVRDLRFVARPPDGRRIEVDPVGEIRSALNLAQSEIVHRARLDLRLDPCPLVLAGQGQIGQVMLHLLVNASQSIPPGAPASHTVRVTSGTDARGWAAIEVGDTGTGVPAAIRVRVFEPFFTTRPAGGGSGLGLSVCHGIVTGLGGRIDLASQEGHGTTVQVLLPPASAALEDTSVR
jgi:signal transduction histidine kinase